MKKLSKILESIWSDMQERGTGDMVKKEDEVNHLDGPGFLEYLKDYYNIPDESWTFQYTEYSDTVSIYTFSSPWVPKKGTYMSFVNTTGFKNGERVMKVDNDIFKHKGLNNLRKALRERYTFKKTDMGTMVFPIDGSPINNQAVIDLIDCIMNNLDPGFVVHIPKIVKESVWSDMQDRGTGDLAKKEDDVDHLDRNGLYDYLQSHYTLINPRYKIVNSPSGDSIEVPVFHKITNTEYIRRWFTKDEVLIPYVFPYMINGLFHLLMHRYKLKQDITGRYYIISPADSSSVTNKFFLEVLDFITEFVPRESRCVEKMVKESVWSDMQERGTGDLAKKEDHVNMMNGERFYEHLKKTYDIRKSKGGYNKFSNGTELIDISLFEYKAPRAIYVDHAGLLYYPSNNAVAIGCTSRKYKKIFSELMSNFFANKEGVYFEKEYFHGVDNKMIIELLDLIIENIKQPLIPLIKK